MAEPGERQAAERVERMVAALLAGRRSKAGPADAEERAALLAAAALAGARDAYPAMSLGFRRRLRTLLQGSRPERWMSRRAALVAGLGVALGALAGSATGRLGEPARRQPAGPTPPAPFEPGGREVVEPRPGLWRDVGLAFEELVEGVPRRVAAGAVGAFVVRRGQRVEAVSAICSHLPCELIWRPADQALNCPCHGRDFSLEGHSLNGEYPLPRLPQVVVRVREGRVEVLGT